MELVCNEAQTLKAFTDDNYAQGSFYFTDLLKNKDIRVNGVRTGKDIVLQSGDTVRYYLLRAREEKPAYYVVYSDENVLIIDKESGVNSEAVFAGLRRVYGDDCYFIHRLDRNTKGLLVFARNAQAETELLELFRDRRVEKIYHALCFHEPKIPQATLTAYLKKDSHNALVRIYDTPVNGAEKIITEYRVLARDGETTKLEVVLHTGKTHQIRAHLAHIACPVVGDMKYGDTARNEASKTTRQRLVAKCLILRSSGVLSYLNSRTFTSRFEAEI